METQSFRPTFGRVLTVAMAVIGVLALVSVATSDGLGAMFRWAGAVAIIPVLTWALFWRPSVDVAESGVTVRNITRTIDLPWPSIKLIDTKYALTLTTDAGKYTAWAAPAPGAIATHRANRQDRLHLPESTYGADKSVRPGDLASTTSGQAAMVIRRRWEKLRDTGHFDDPTLERPEPVVRWHWDVALIVGVLVVWSVIAIIT